MAGDVLKTKLAALTALRRNLEPDLCVLRNALGDRSNFVVAKAAGIIAERGLNELTADLLASFERLIEVGANADPLCLAKKAVVQALRDLDVREPAPYLRGLRCVQHEPVYGGSTDTAAGLRALCAIGYAESDAASDDVLRALVDALADPYKEVRIEVLRAIESVGGTESVLLLRLKARLGDGEPEVLGQCFTSLLRRERTEAVALVTEALASKNSDVVFEAATALASSREPQAIASIAAFWGTSVAMDLRRAILFSLAESPRAEAAELLISAIASGRSELARTALTALAASRFRLSGRDRIKAAVDGTGNPAITRAFADAFDERD